MSATPPLALRIAPDTLRRALLVAFALQLPALLVQGARTAALAQGVRRDARVSVINGPIGRMRQDLRAWLAAKPARGDRS